VTELSLDSALNIRKFLWLISALSILAAYAGFLFESQAQIDYQSAFLQKEAAAVAGEIGSKSRNTDVMGAVETLGLSDANVKSDASRTSAPNGPEITESFSAVGKKFNADAVFVADDAGILQTTWQKYGGTSTGIDTGFRPYFQRAISGESAFYPAISIGGDRGIYYAAPIYRTRSSDSNIIGVVVMRIGLAGLDHILKDHGDLSFLISPQGIVFSASKPDEIGKISGIPTPEQKAALVAQKQFGKIFDGTEPAQLQISVTPGVQRLNGKQYAVVTAPIAWKDPQGEWRLVLMEDLTRGADMRRQFIAGAGAGTLVFVFLLVCLNLVQKNRAKRSVDIALLRSAEQQSMITARKTNVADAALALNRADNTGELARLFLAECHRLIGITHGLIYITNKAGPNRLHFAAGFGRAGDTAQIVDFGDGLLGQCAIDRRLFLFGVGKDGSDSAAESGRSAMNWEIRSGLGMTSPRSVIIAPVLAYDDLVGVVEISSAHRLDDGDLLLFHELLPFLATGLLLKSALEFERQDQ